MLMYQSIPAPRYTRVIWLEFSPVQWGIWPKWDPPGRAFDFQVKTLVSRCKQKEFILFFPSACVPCSLAIAAVDFMCNQKILYR